MEAPLSETSWKLRERSNVVTRKEKVHNNNVIHLDQSKNKNNLYIIHNLPHFVPKNKNKDNKN